MKTAKKVKTVRIKPSERGEHQIEKVDKYLAAGYPVDVVYTDEDGNETERSHFNPGPSSKIIIIDLDQDGNEMEQTPLDLVPQFGKLTIIQKDLNGKEIFRFERKVG
ncbi:MAG: hypothetical protein WCE46_02470 [Methanoregula sp.]|uniref:hypothetical protein n=1 Tax=Methanoregula sp. TaxID=2052170 RepID=UPI003C7778DC